MSSQQPQDQRSPWAAKEEAMVSSWEKNNIFGKSLKQNESNTPFVFYDGPPFATGQPHYGHLLPGTIKDIIPRYQTMNGRYVRRQWGWDCHGLPVENIIEKELNLSSKKDILNLGIDKFNEAARNTVLRYEKEWKEVIPRTGRFIDMSRPYMTMQPAYTESVWWAFKQLYDKGLVYEGFKSMHLCPRCETTLSNFEVAQGYKDLTDISVYAAFKVQENTYIVAWTTTPWTLPGNVALAVGADVAYVYAKVVSAPEKSENFKDSVVIVAKERLAALEGYTFEVQKEVKGKDLVGFSYEPLFPYYASQNDLKQKENGWKVYSADFVTTTDGTGVVHIAPAFGNDDYQLSVKEKLPFVQHVAINGTFKPEVTDFAGMSVKPKSEAKDGHQATDIEIIKYLAGKGRLFAKQKLVHSYPTCWRCDTPLLNYATSSWFIKVSDPKFKKQIIEENKKVMWVPEHIKEGRFGNWLEGAADWAISRSRFWGAPLPVWKSEDGKEVVVVDTRETLRKYSKANNEYHVMRHGESENNVRGILTRDLKGEYGLSEKGIGQVKESLKGMKSFDLIVASPVRRTKQTAEMVREFLGLETHQLVFDERLLEVNAGVFEGKTTLEWHNSFLGGDQFSAAPEGGESMEDIQKRSGEVLYDLEQKYSGKKILIVTHASVAWLLTAVSKGWTKEESIANRNGEFIKNAQVLALDFKQMPHNEAFVFDAHRPYVDDVILYGKNGSILRRIPEVFDCWFESGSMPFAQYYYTGTPVEKEGKVVFDPKKEIGFPADFIAESLDQTRGWFYTLLVIGTGLFGQSPYKSVVCSGLVLAEDGRKMSKRLKNYPEVSYVLNKYGADAMRLYLMSQPVVKGEELRFSERGVDEVYKKNIVRLQNAVSLLEMYKKEGETWSNDLTVSNWLPFEMWFYARLCQIGEKMDKAYKSYDINKIVAEIIDAVEHVTNTYLRGSRENIRESADNRARAAYLLKLFATLIAPVVPFIAEDVYQRLGGAKESVHLESWPFGEGKVLHALDAKKDAGLFEVLSWMEKTMEIRTKVLALRDEAGIKVRQPLASITVQEILPKEFETILLSEVNVLSVIVDPNKEVSLDTTITPELKAKGLVRDIVRAVQDARKQSGAKPDEEKKVTVALPASDLEMIKNFIREIEKATRATVTLQAGDSLSATCH